MTAPLLYIGLMSGTSIDAVDAVLLSVRDNHFSVLASASTPVGDTLKDHVRTLSQPGKDSIDLFGATDKAIGELFAKTALKLLANEGLDASKITAIGSHGQTIRHRPHPACAENHFTVQIGDPSTIAARTGITTVADFRRKDMALGGQGAPLVPAFHRDVFSHQTLNRAIINIGGIANITWLPATSREETIIGFDCGPGNCLMDLWSQRHQNQPFDREGQWARSGTVNPSLLDALLAEPYLAELPPKSTGKEMFNANWLDAHLESIGAPVSPGDVQATLCRYTGISIANALKLIPGALPVDEVYVCGGGAFNNHLLTLLQAQLGPVPVRSSAEAGIHPQLVEGAAFAWLAHRTLNRLPGSLATATGANRDAVLGGIFFP